MFEDNSYTFYYLNIDKCRNDFEFQKALILYNIDFISTVIIKGDSKEYTLNYNDITSIRGEFKLE